MRVASWASIAAVSTLLAGSAEAMPAPAPYRARIRGLSWPKEGAGPLSSVMPLARACHTAEAGAWL